MIIIPKEKPAIRNLNSYYLNINKLIEHYQGELGSGVVHFESPTMQCALFFDEYQVINGCFEDKKGVVGGGAAIERIMRMASTSNFVVSVYGIRTDRLYYWANLSNSEVLYDGLTTEFTDLEGLLRKMEAEKLTGCIDARLKGDFKGGLLFFFNGETIGGLSAEDSGNIDRSGAFRDELVNRSRAYGGEFSVSRIFLDNAENGSPLTPQAPTKAKQKKTVSAAEKPQEKRRSAEKKDRRIVSMLEGLLGTLERVVRKNRKIRHDFETLLNRKFVEKVDTYEFLDPFAAEFQYADGKVIFTGDASPKELVAAISETVSEIAGETGITSELRRELHPWRQTFADEMIEFDLRL